MKRNVLLLAVPTAVLFLFLITAASADDRQNTGPSLTVRGEAVLKVNADQVRFQVGVLSEGQSAAAALAANNRQMQAVAKAMREAGLTAAEYETGRFLVQPRWSPRPRNAKSDWKPAIIGYQVSNNYLVRTGKLEIAGQVIEAAIRAGANQVHDLVFGLAEPRKYRSRAIAAAAANALGDARELAAAAGLELTSILAINLDEATVASRRGPRPAYNRALLQTAPGTAGLELAAGKIPVRAAVTVTYGIKNR